MRNGIIEAVWPEGISPIVLISVIWMFEGVFVEVIWSESADSAARFTSRA